MEILTGMRETLDRLKNDKSSFERPKGILRRHTSVVDDIIRELHRELRVGSEGSGMTLVAVGGYGRRELTPWSDVDLMFLCTDTSSKEIIQTIHNVLHALWDIGLDVGHSVRTIDDCVSVSLKDIPTWTALMDARFLIGDPELFGIFQERFQVGFFREERETFLGRLIQGVWERHRRYSRTPFLVEPNLKEGPGGLRDFQSALWVARCLFPVRELTDLVDHALISRDEAAELQEAYDFLWKTRLLIHRQVERKEDQLRFDIQERLSRQTLRSHASADEQVETFMRLFYKHATMVRHFVEDIIHKGTDPSLAAGPEGPSFIPEELGDGFLVVRGRLTLQDDAVFERDPLRIMEAIAFAHRAGYELDIFTRDQIKASVRLLDASFRKAKRVREALLSVLDTPDCGHRALGLMHRLGVLQACIPEFQSICFQVQHDAYHAYTVDLHSLEAVAELARIRKEAAGDPEELKGRAVKRIKQWPPLVLAVLLHDIGKGEGSGHAARGSKLADKLLKRWRLSERDRSRIVFLIREHLLLMNTALGRDLNDEKAIADFGRAVGSTKRLDDLYLMTLADLRATGPDLLSDWKDQLMRELYLKTRHLLETGELVSPEAAQKINAARATVAEGIKDIVDAKELTRWVQSLPERYLLTTPREDLVDQVLMARRMDQAREILSLSHRPKEGYQEIVICTRDAPALFSRICGVLVAHGFNILAARIHTWTNGIVMDTFTVETIGGLEDLDTDRLSALREDLTAVLSKREDLEDLLSRRAPSPLVLLDRHPAVSPRIKIDNRSSDFYTIAEVRARDRFGLLFSMTRAMSSLDLSIHLALIDTRRGQIFDVFYVQEVTGQKVLDEDRIALLERELHRTMEQVEGDAGHRE